jgi:signal transduction histidine kinase
MPVISSVVPPALDDASEHRRLSRELQQCKLELSEALEQQKATSEVLKTISRSTFDLQPVLETLIENAVRLCAAECGIVYRFDGQLQRLAAAYRMPPEFKAFVEAHPIQPGRGTAAGRAALERRTVHIPDVTADPDYRYPAAYTLGNIRSILGVPMLREGEPMGVMTIWRSKVQPFTERQIELLTGFADQAVIAIENTRLFHEIKEALDQQTATSEILSAISQSPIDVQPVFDTIARAALRLCNARSACVHLLQGEWLNTAALAIVNPDGRDAIQKLYPRRPDQRTVSGRVILARGVVTVPDVLEDPAYGADAAAVIAGFRSMLGVPMLREGRPVGSLVVGRPQPGPFPPQQVALLQTFADQAVIAIENMRLFNELRDKGVQLELASRHKSQFLANMSHELRTPLNAIIGFTRIVMRRAGDQIEPKQYENLEKILASGQHLLALINAILDLSKIEAGHVEVDAKETELAPMLEQCLLTIEPLFKADTVALVTEIDDVLPPMLVDAEKLRQIVINLLSNAAKFTACGSIRLRAQAANECVTIAVTDTGIGIPADKLDLVFEEFEQADARSRDIYGGTGLGLAIARRLARLMDGDITVESCAGSGSTFTLTLPLRYRAAMSA